MSKPEEPESVEPMFELVTVRIVQGYMLAQVIKSKLESENIPVLLRYESVGRVLGITFDGLGQVKVMVPAPLLEEAERALATDEPLTDLPPTESPKSDD